MWCPTIGGVDYNDELLPALTSACITVLLRSTPCCCIEQSGHEEDEQI